MLSADWRMSHGSITTMTIRVWKNTSSMVPISTDSLRTVAPDAALTRVAITIQKMPRSAPCLV